MITRRELLAMLTAAGVALQMRGEDAPELLTGPIENEGFEEGSEALEVPDTPARFSWTPEGGKAVEIKRVESVSVEMDAMVFPIDGMMESRQARSGTVTLESDECWDPDLAALGQGRLRFGIDRWTTFDVQAMVVECTRELGPVLYRQRTVFRYWGPFTQSAV